MEGNGETSMEMLVPPVKDKEIPPKADFIFQFSMSSQVDTILDRSLKGHYGGSKLKVTT